MVKGNINCPALTVDKTGAPRGGTDRHNEPLKNPNTKKASCKKREESQPTTVMLLHTILRTGLSLFRDYLSSSVGEEGGGNYCDNDPWRCYNRL